MSIYIQAEMLWSHHGTTGLIDTCHKIGHGCIWGNFISWLIWNVWPHCRIVALFHFYCCISIAVQGLLLLLQHTAARPVRSGALPQSYLGSQRVVALKAREECFGRPFFSLLGLHFILYRSFVHIHAVALLFVVWGCCRLLWWPWVADRLVIAAFRPMLLYFFFCESAALLKSCG